MTIMKNTYIGFGSLLMTGFLYGLFAILVRTVGFEFPIFFQMWTRNIIGTLILLAFIVFGHDWIKVRKQDYIWLVLRTIAGIFAYITSYIAFFYIQIGTAYFAYYCGSVFGGYLIGKFLFKEKITLIKIIALILSIIGLFFIYSFNLETNKSIYILIALSSGLVASVWDIFSKKISHIYSATQLNFIDFGLFFVFTFIISITLKETWVMPELSTPWVVNAIFGVIYVICGQLIIYGFKYLDAQIGSLVMLMDAVFGIILGYLIYRETLSLMTLLGGILIFTATILPIVKFKKIDIITSS